jgi:hypothetical protein
VPKHWGEDTLLTRINTGFMDNSYAPQGWIAITDPDGKKWELFACGMRNQYDIKVNNVGELFTWDADMEWDMGDPVVSAHALDPRHQRRGLRLPQRLGQMAGALPRQLREPGGHRRGSPTGDTFGYGAKFPKKYQDALFFLDHQYGPNLRRASDSERFELHGGRGIVLSAQPFNAAGHHDQSRRWRDVHGPRRTFFPVVALAHQLHRH